MLQELICFRLTFNIYSLLGSSTPPVTMATGKAEVIVTVGGEDDKVVLRSVESFDPVTNQWKNLACLPFAVSKHGLVVSGEETSTRLRLELDNDAPNCVPPETSQICVARHK